MQNLQTLDATLKKCNLSGNMEILAESAQAVMLFLREKGYTEEILSRLGLSKLPRNDRARRLASAWVVTGDGRLDLLIWLFYLGESMMASHSEKFIPKEILQACLRAGSWSVTGSGCDRLAC